MLAFSHEAPRKRSMKKSWKRKATKPVTRNLRRKKSVYEFKGTRKTKTRKRKGTYSSGGRRRKDARI